MRKNRRHYLLTDPRKFKNTLLYVWATLGRSQTTKDSILTNYLNKKTQIQLHSFKITILTINLSLYNIISVHFHRFGPPFNKSMYSSPVKSKVLSPKPLTHGRFHGLFVLFVLQLLYSDEPIV